MLLNAVIICCMIVVNAESPLNSYSFTGDSNGYDYSNSVTNSGYLGSKDGYQNAGGFYVGDTSRKLANHASSHSLINTGNQGNIGSDIGNNYNGYSANDHGSEYTGYSNTYENFDRDTYGFSTHATPTLFKGYSGTQSNNGDRAFNTYSSSSVHQDSDFGQYGSSSKRIPIYSGYPKPTVENYSEDSADNDAQGYHDSSDSPAGYSDNDQVYPQSYSSSGSTNDYSVVKQKVGPYSFKGRNKYGDIYSASETRYTRGNVAHVSHNHDVPSYLSDSRPSGQFYKAHGPSSAYTSRKPSKYSYKYLTSRYAPNSGLSYSRERDYYTPYNKGSGKIIMIKDSRPSYVGHAYSEPSSFVDNGYRSKSSGFMGGYSTSSNFDGYLGGSNNYDDGPTMPRRYRYAGPMVLQKTVYS